MNQKQKLTHYKSKAEQFRDAFFEQKEEIMKLKSTLADISVGLVQASTKDNGWSHELRMRYDAARALTSFKHTHEPKGPFYI